MKKARLILLFSALAIIAAVVVIAIQLYNKPHINIQKEKPAYTLNAQELINAFNEDESGSNLKFVDKVLLLSGSLAGWNKDPDGNITLYLEDELFGISCQMDNLSQGDLELKLGNDLIPGTQIKIKGKCDGILSDVILTRCILLE